MQNDAQGSGVLIPGGLKNTNINGQQDDVGAFVEVAVELIVTSVTGTSPTLTVKIQDSEDGSDWTDIAGGAFPSVTATGNYRLEITQFGRYIRAVATLGGTSPAFSYSVIDEGKIH